MVDATVVGRLSTTIPPPLPVAVLFEIVDVLMLAEPDPIPPGEAKANMYRSKPPPPMPDEVLRLTVVPVTVRVPVPPVCIGEEGV